MKTAFFKPFVALAASAFLAVSLGACSSGAGSSGADSSGSGSSGSAKQGEVLPPILVAPSDLAGKTFEITKEQPLVINVEDPSTVADWAGSADDSVVAKFVPGEDDGSAQFNPGFEAVGSGSTDASVIAPDGEVFEFTITVP